jgi:GlpG protein
MEMRKIGGDLSKDQANRFSDYLLTIGIDAVVDQAEGDRYELWARHEDQLQDAKLQLREFQSDPEASRYQVDKKAETLRRRQEKERREKLKLQQRFKPQKVSARTAGGRVTIGVILVCAAVSLVTDFGNVSVRQIQRDGGTIPMNFRIYNSLTLLPQIDRPADAGPLDAVFRGQVWRLVTPIFLHGNIMHLVFNCLFLFSFGRVVETLFGPMFFLLLFLIGGIVGLLAQAYGPLAFGASPDSIGASGGALALFSFLWLRPRFEPATPFRVMPTTALFVMGFVILSMLPFAPIGNVANLAHLGGLVAGAVIAAGPLDSLRR